MHGPVPDAIHNLALALGKCSDTLSGPPRTAMLRRTATQWEQVCALRPDDADSHHNLGLALGTLASVESKGRQTILEAALAAFVRACELRPDDPDTWYQRALTCGQLSELEHGPPRLDMLGQSVVAARRANQLQPDRAPILNALGIALALFSDGISGPHQQTRLRESATVLERLGDVLQERLCSLRPFGLGGP